MFELKGRRFQLATFQGQTEDVASVLLGIVNLEFGGLGPPTDSLLQSHCFSGGESNVKSNFGLLQDVVLTGTLLLLGHMAKAQSFLLVAEVTLHVVQW